MIADVVALFHALIPLTIVGMTVAAAAERAWIVPFLVLLVFVNWELDADRKCVITRLEAHLRDEPMAEFRGFLWYHVGKHFGIAFAEFDRAVNTAFLVLAIIALLRYKHYVDKGCR